ncbi:MAG: PAS domain-containing protein [Rhizomicrobium sp.]
MPPNLMQPNRQPPWDAFNARAGREGWTVVCDASLAFDCARLKELLEIWRRVKGPRHLPTRADFTARALVRHLKDIVFIERLQEPDRSRRYRFRMVGRDQVRSGSDVTGKYLDEVILPPFLASWYDAYDMALDIAAPLRFVSHLRSLGLDHMTAETLITPLGDAAGAPWGLLTSTAFEPRTA